jgi:pyruvate ferredoxin oxidoreductase gamma subunit
MNHEIRWHGRGGQGAVTSAQILAQAAYCAKFRGVTSAPSFGAERRGAPVTASTRLSPEPLRIFSQIEFPDIVIVLDDTLLKCADATAGLKEGGWLLVNSHLPPKALGYNGFFSTATADATQIAIDLGLLVAGTVIVNTAMLGMFARATQLVSMEDVRQAIHAKYVPALAEKNFEAARITYEQTMIG